MPDAPSLPRPEAGELGCYLVGPGFGESVVVLAADTCIVVDSCKRGEAHLTLSVLDALGVSEVDLLVVTHPDLDHMRGLAALLRVRRPRRVWRYPSNSLRDLAAFWLRRDPEDTRLGELHAALVALDDVEAEGLVYDANLDLRPHDLTSRCRISCLAPTQFDQSQSRKALRDVLRRAGDEPELAARLRDYLVGERSSLGDHPNTLSLAVVVQYGEHRVLLAGDVENGKPTVDRSGWKGVLMHLREEDRLAEVTGLDLVKVAHHGSYGAFDLATWRHHAREDHRTTAVLTPFSAARLPDQGTLSDLGEYASVLGISADAGGAFDRAKQAGWVEAESSSVTAPASMLAVLMGDGPARLFSGAGASFFVRGP